jgi:hypothetical protein
VPRTFITFEAPPSSSTPPGRELAAALQLELQAEFHAWELAERDDYGWEFEVTIGQDRCNLILQLSDTWLLIIAPVKRFLGVLGGPSNASLVNLGRGVHDALQRAGASSLRWFTQAEFESRSPGAPSPDAAA